MATAPATPLVRALSRAKSSGVLVVGASNKPQRASNDVMYSLMNFNKVECTPINPMETAVLEKECFKSLSEYVEKTKNTEKVICVFRSDVEPVVQEALDLGFNSIWLQYDLFLPEKFKQIVLDKKVDVVEDRCLKVEMAREGSKL